MHVDFDQSARQVTQQAGQTIRCELTRPRQSENRIWREEASVAYLRPKPPRATGRCERSRGNVFVLDAPDRPERLQRDANGPRAEAERDRNDISPHHGMQMVMFMDVDVIQPEAGPEICRELRLDLLAHLRAQSLRTCKLESELHEITAHAAGIVDKTRYFPGRQHRLLSKQNQMQPYPQLRQTPRPSQGIFRSRTCHHQTRCTQDAVSMRDLDGFVDLFSQAEIIRGYDQVIALSFER